MSTRPEPTQGLRHLALWIQQWDACLNFYNNILGMEIEWQPDPDNIYLTSGNDNLALHRAAADFQPTEHQRLDHLGFIITAPEQVDTWHAYLDSRGVALKTAPKDHRDGARSFYCADPDGNSVQFIYHPPLSINRAQD